MALKTTTTMYNRMMIINDGWLKHKIKPIPALVADKKSPAESEMEIFAEHLKVHQNFPDRIPGTELDQADILLRIDVDLREVPEREKVELKLFEQIWTSFPAQKYLYLFHGRDRNELSLSVKSKWVEIANRRTNTGGLQVAFGDFSRLEGKIYGKNGGLIASKGYYMGQRVKDGEAAKLVRVEDQSTGYYEIDLRRYNRAWDAYFPREIAIIVRKLLILLHAMKNRKTASFGRFYQELVEEVSALITILQGLSVPITSENSNQDFHSRLLKTLPACKEKLSLANANSEMQEIDFDLITEDLNSLVSALK